MMQALSCNSCNKEFEDDNDQKLHYKSEWHRYNLKRKIAGVPGVTEALFIARQAVLAQEKKKSEEVVPLLYSCGLCGKGYKSAKAHAQHLKSKSHLSQASQDSESSAIITPLPRRIEKIVVNVPLPNEVSESEESEESEWEEVDSDEEVADEALKSLEQMKVNDQDSDHSMDEEEDDDVEELDPSCCFMCDLKHETIESCMVHMHKQHGFFIPDVEYLKDPKGFLTYLGLKVKKDFICLYCDERTHPFSSLEAVRKHMEAKGHCKVHYGDGGDDEEGELEEFYDYSSSYVDTDGNQMVASTDMQDSIFLGTGGSELIIRKRANNGVSTKILGSREFLRYYRQKPRPTATNGVSESALLAARYRSMGLATVQSKEHIVRLKILKAMNKTGVEIMRSKMGMKSNVIRNLPKNVTH